jgi:hypothetical protein
MNLKLSNYGKRSHPLFRNVANILLYFLAAELPIITTLPISDSLKLWIGIGISEITLIIKTISQFSINPNFQENENINEQTSGRP